MAVVRRFDAGELAPPVRTREGWLRAEGRIARVGIQEYEDASGKKHRELRLPEEVGDPDSLASFRLVPLTNTHPPMLLDSTNATSFAKGSSGEEVRFDGEWVRAPLCIIDGPTIGYVDAGRAQLSNGYTCELDPTQDVALIQKWGRYDFIQRKIRGNHIALVDEARAGPGATLRLDGSDARSVAKSNPALPTPRGERPMAQLRFDGLTFDLADANSAAIQQAIDRMTSSLSEKKDAAVHAEKTRADAAEKKLQVVLDNAKALLGKLGRLRAIWDAMKAKMVKCDECDGSGKTVDPSDNTKQVKCDMCDGSGEFRMHSAVKGAKDDDEGDEDEDLDDELSGEEMDEDELATEQETEESAGAAKKDSKKRKDARRQRHEDAVEFATKRDASLQRRVDQGVRARVALETEARRFAPDADFSKLDANGIRRAVILKLSPQAKLDGKSAAEIRARYDAETERGGTANVDELRRRTAGVERTGAPPRADGAGLRGRELYQHRLLNPGK